MNAPTLKIRYFNDRWHVAGGDAPVNWQPLPQTLRTRKDLDQYFARGSSLSPAKLVYASPEGRPVIHYEVKWNLYGFPSASEDRGAIYIPNMESYSQPPEIVKHLDERAKSKGMGCEIVFLSDPPQPPEPDED